MSEIVSNFHFIRPALLLLVPVVVAVWWGWRGVSDSLRGWRMQMDPELLKALVTGRSAGAGSVEYVLLIAWLMAVVAVAGPTWRLEPSPFTEDSTPLIILLKADMSMDTPDPAPSRIERAQLKIADIAGARKGQPLGLIAYAGSAHLVLPPTRDTEVVAQLAAEISPAIMPVPGDRLELALREAGELLKETSGMVLVIADSVQSDAASLKSVQKEFGFRTMFLLAGNPDSGASSSVRAAARALNAKVEDLTPDDQDVAALVRIAARTPRVIKLEGGERWQEAGYALVPVLVLLAAFSFRRETPDGEASE